jgi:hypothetical protein
VQITFGSHVPESEQSDAHKRAVLQPAAREYEIVESDTTSVVGNPAYASDRAYMGHMVNDGAFCADPAGRQKYEIESEARQNAEK